MLSVAVMSPDEIKLVDIPEPVPGPYQAKVRVEAACLCNATDRKLVEGHFPGVEDYPLLLGHENAGIVVAVGAKVRSFKVGDRVIGGLLLDTTDPAYASGWGGFSEYVLAGDHVAMVEDGVADAAHGWHEVDEIMRAVPPTIPVEAAVLLCTWREVYAAFGDFNLRPGDDILIFGGGPVGLSFVKFARLLGLGFIGLVDLLPEKRAKALQMGADAVFAPDDTALVNWREPAGQTAGCGHRRGRARGDHQRRAAADQDGRLGLRLRRDRHTFGSAGKNPRAVQLQPADPPVADPFPGGGRAGAALRVDRRGEAEPH